MTNKPEVDSAGIEVVVSEGSELVSDSEIRNFENSVQKWTINLRLSTRKALRWTTVNLHRE